MSRRAKIWLGWASFGPLFATGQFLLVLVLTEVVAASWPKSALPTIRPIASTIGSALLFYCMACWGVGGIACLVATVICERHFEAQSVKFWQKLRWRIIWIFWPLATPAYWYYFIWREQKFEAPPFKPERANQIIMSRRAKIWWGWAAFSPYIFLAIYNLINLTEQFFPAVLAPGKVGGPFPIQGWVVLGAMAITAIVSCVAASTFQRHLKAQKFPVWQERRWNLFLQVLWPVAIGIYWYRFIWREEKFEPTPISDT